MFGSVIGTDIHTVSLPSFPWFSIYTVAKKWEAHPVMCPWLEALPNRISAALKLPFVITLYDLDTAQLV